MKSFVIFDLDGTLLNSLEDLADACNYALQNQGFPVHAVEPYKFFVGNGIYRLIQRALPGGISDEATIMRVKSDFDMYYSAHSRDKTAPYPGIMELLQILKEKNISVAVLSNKPDLYTGQLVRDYFSDFVDIAVGQRDGVPIKPDPVAVFEIMSRIGADTRDGIYVGDTATDIETGNNAGLFSVGVLWGFRTKEELLNAGANAIIAKPSELLSFVLDKN